MPLETVVGGVIVGSLILYALLGGADYGGGVWDLFAVGPRAPEQRRLIAKAISPVWEANHVWLILVVVILFTAFPPAFAAIATALHIPITLLLIGIVLRGTAFTFRTYDVQRDDVQRRWSLVFSIASIITPILLGTTLGAIASGTIRVENGFVSSGFFSSWLAPFPLAVGFFALALFAFLAAVYLTVEAEDEKLKEDFRLRSLLSGAAVGLLALTVFILAGTGAPTVRAGITYVVGVRPAFLYRRLCNERLLLPLDQTLQSSATLRCRPGDVDSSRLGTRSVSTPRGTRPDDNFRRRAKDHTGAVTRRTRCRCDLAVSVLLLFNPCIQS